MITIEGCDTCPSLGDITTDVSKVIAMAPQFIDIAASVLKDPALPRVAGKLREISKMENSSGRQGIALGQLDTALGFYIAIRKNPILLYLGLAGIFLGPLLIGYAFARRRRS